MSQYFLYYSEIKETKKPELLGKKVLLHPDSENAAIIQTVMGNSNTGNVYKYHRYQREDGTYYSMEYQMGKNNNSNTILYLQDGICVGRIMFFFKCGDEIMVMLQKFYTSPITFEEPSRNAILAKYRNLEMCSNVKKIIDQTTKIVIPVSNIIKKCVYINIHNGDAFVSIPPNLLEHS